MKNLMAPNIPLTLILFAALAAVALRAGARRPEPPEAPGTRHAPVTVRPGQSQPRPAAGLPRSASYRAASSPGTRTP